MKPLTPFRLWLDGGVICAVLSACSGAGGTGNTAASAPLPGTAPAPPATATAGNGALQIQIAIPRSSIGKESGTQMRTPQYVSSGTQSVTVIVTPSGRAAGPSTLIGCSNGTCSGTVAAPTGLNTVTVNLYDQPNGAGHLLSTGTSTVTVSASASNSVYLTLNGVVSTMSVTLPTVTVFSATSSSATVTALDASGATISGAYANPITVAVADTAATITAGTSQLHASTDTLTLNYNGIPDPTGATVTLSASGATPSAQVLSPAGVIQGFSGSNVSNWSNGTGGIACLTAGDGSGSLPACASGGPGGTSGTLPDSPGSGALRLAATPTLHAASFAVYAPVFPTQYGLIATFDMYVYDEGGCPPTGGDGMALFMLDGGAAVPTVPGGFGGNLGYDGMSAGYLAVGLDEYGNWSTAPGGPGITPETVAVRGSISGTPANNYLIGYQVAGVPSSLPFNLNAASATRVSTNKRTVRFTLTAAAQIKVEIDSGGGFVTYIPLTALSGFPSQPALPSTVRIGFSAGTGGCENVYEVQNLTIL